MTEPIKPSEVQGLKNSKIPPEVIEAFNELIAENWDGNEATVKLKEAVSRIKSKMEIKTEQLFDRGYLDVEPLFRKKGWKVKYDQPAYCENYAAFFVFSKR